MKKGTYSVYLLLVGILVVSVACARGSQPRTSQAVLAPDFALTTVEGQRIKLSDFRGRPVLLNFWATWCPPCLEEMPIMQAVYEELAKYGLVILAVDVAEEARVVKTFIENEKLSFVFAMDYDGSVSQTYGVRPLPTTFLIDKNGYVKVARAGAFRNRAELREVLKAIME